MFSPAGPQPGSGITPGQSRVQASRRSLTSSLARGSFRRGARAVSEPKPSRGFALAQPAASDCQTMSRNRVDLARANDRHPSRSAVSLAKAHSPQPPPRCRKGRGGPGRSGLAFEAPASGPCAASPVGRADGRDSPGRQARPLPIGRRSCWPCDLRAISRQSPAASARQSRQATSARAPARDREPCVPDACRGSRNAPPAGLPLPGMKLYRSSKPSSWPPPRPEPAPAADRQMVHPKDSRHS